MRYDKLRGLPKQQRESQHLYHSLPTPIPDSVSPRRFYFLFYFISNSVSITVKYGREYATSVSNVCMCPFAYVKCPYIILRISWGWLGPQIEDA